MPALSLTDGIASDGTQKDPKGKVTKFIKLLVFLIVAAFLIVRSSGPAGTTEMKLRLYTNNIRFDNKNLSPGEHPWSERRPLVVESIRFHTQAGPAVVCLQEVLHNQLQDILKDLNLKDEDEWSYYGVGRTDGKQKGEYAPIFYRNEDWKAVETQTYWLSPTPLKPSKGWDAALERIVTTVILELRHDGTRVKVLNTHFDHKGVQARRELAKLIMDKMELGPEPPFLCGDFNTEPKDEPYRLLTEGGFKDSRIQGVAYGYSTTFSGFNRDKEDNTIIDYIWAGEGSKWRTYGVVPNYFKYYMSDHRPVIADYTIGGSLGGSWRRFRYLLSN